MQEAEGKDARVNHLRRKIQFYLIDSNTPTGKLIDIVIIILNLLVVALFIANTYDISDNTKILLEQMEEIVVVFFIIEYIARLYGSRHRFKHIFNIYSLIDLLAILPEIIAFIIVGSGQIGIFKLFRVFRVFRVLRFLRFFETSEFFFGNVAEEKLKILRVIMTVFMIFFVSSGLFYLVEFSDNGNVANFGDAFYFTVVALTTVGFGDIVPVTESGKLVTILCILSGIVLIPWQVAEIIKGWINISDKQLVHCEKCGLSHHEFDAVHCKMCGDIIFHDEHTRET